MKYPASHRNIQKKTTLHITAKNKIIFIRVYQKIPERKNLLFIILLTGISKTEIPIVANYIRSTRKAINPNLRSPKGY